MLALAAMAPRTGDTQGPYHPGLDETLLPRYGSDLYLVGQIDGLLGALECLSSYLNHAASFGLLELAVSEAGPEATLRAHYAHRGEGLALRPAGEWASAVRAALTRVAIDESALARPVREPLLSAVARVVDLLARLFRERAVQAFYLVREGARGPIGPYGYLSDESIAFVLGDGRVFVLGLGWTD